MKRVRRTATYAQDLDAIEAHVALDSPNAAADLCLHIDDQVAQLADLNFPRRMGRVPGTFELVAHPNYIVVFIEDATTVTVLNVVHVRRRYPA
jgi:toxin ParE1/3/4